MEFKSETNSRPNDESRVMDQTGTLLLSIGTTTIRIIDASKIMETSPVPAEKEEEPCIKAFDTRFDDLDSVLGSVHKIPPAATQKQVGLESKVLDDHHVQKGAPAELKKQKGRKKKRMNTKLGIKVKARKEKTKGSPSTDILYACDICGKSYKDKNYLPEHMQRHNKIKQLKCDMCDASFNIEKDLKNHLNSHLKEKPFLCKLCNKRFTRSSLLNYHIRIHTGERPYICDIGICRLTFTRPFGLSQHKRRVHSSNKGRTIKCTECDRMFVTVIERDEHITSVHIKRKPFKCSVCQKRFKHRLSLKYHEKEQHSTDEPYTCLSSDCDKKFKTLARLSCHMKGHKDFLYKCPHCPLEFKMKNELNLHMKSLKSHKKTKK